MICFRAEQYVNIHPSMLPMLFKDKLIDGFSVCFLDLSYGYYNFTNLDSELLLLIEKFFLSKRSGYKR
jgi:hypothetical protein